MVKKRLLRLVKILAGASTGAEAEFSRLERFAHFWALAGRSFVRNRCLERAAALSYTSLLALIPLLAVAIGVTSSLLKNQGEEKIYGAIDRLVSNFIPPATNSVPETSSAMVSADNSVAQTNSIPPAETDTRVGAAQK
jgi:membrane protein